MNKLLPILFLTTITLGAVAQKTVSEATITYDYVVSTSGSEPKMADALDGATNTIYIKGQQSRSDLVNVLGTESTVYDSKTGKAFILKEYSGQKLMITLTKENWGEKNKAYKDVTYEYLQGETKTIAGYECKKAIAKFASGRTITVYYTTDLSITNKDYSSEFKGLPGVAMQYELEAGKTKLTCTVSKISFETISALKFDEPKSGYRVMTYDENKKLKKEEKKN